MNEEHEPLPDLSGIPEDRWLRPSYSFDDLNRKTVSVDYTRKDGQSYHGEGELLPRQRPDGSMLIELHLTRWLGARGEVTVFILSSRQVAQLKLTTEGTDFRYEGLLKDDEEPG